MTERKTSLEKLPYDILNEISNYTSSLPLHKTSKTIKNLNLFTFEKEKVRFEKFLPYILKEKNFVLDGHEYTFLLKYEYVHAMMYFWRSGKYLDLFYVINLDYCTSHIFPSAYYYEELKKTILTTNYNKWATKNIRGLTDFMMKIFEITLDPYVTILLIDNPNNNIEFIEWMKTINNLIVSSQINYNKLYIECANRLAKDLKLEPDPNFLASLDERYNKPTKSENYYYEVKTDEMCEGFKMLITDILLRYDLFEKNSDLLNLIWKYESAKCKFYFDNNFIWGGNTRDLDFFIDKLDTQSEQRVLSLLHIARRNKDREKINIIESYLENNKK